jgi:hypothetical protein
MVQPAASHQLWNSARPSASSSVSVWRLLPPATPGPILAISIRLSQRRSPLIFRFSPGAAMPRIHDIIEGPLKALVDEKAAVIRGWAEAGRIAPVDPYHLIFSIWATTQHYADFDVQVRGILGSAAAHRFDDAAGFLEHLYRRALAP